MSGTYIQYTLSLNITAPFLSHKSGAQRFSYDMSMLRNAQGQPVFLGSQIRGNLLHTLIYFQKQLPENSPHHQALASVINQFGKPSGNTEETAYAPQRGNLHFSYYWLPDVAAGPAAQNPQPPRYRIGIDTATGCTEEDNLQVIETVAPSGQSLNFTGTITAQLDEKQAQACHYWLNKASQYLPAIGALKGTGFGRIQSATCSWKPVGLQAVEALSSGARIGLTLKPDRPFCIARPHLPNSNRFVSEDFIPGNAIIGAIARQYPKLASQDWFDKIHIRHAIASSSTDPARPAALPLSLAFHNGKLIDWAQMPGPDSIFLCKANDEFHAPAFQPDWKGQDYKEASQRCGLPETDHERHLVVRTAIDGTTHQAQDQSLFSLECIEPNNTVWHTEIDLSHLTETEKKSALAEFGQILSHPLRGIGKTKACASLNVLPNPVTPTPDIQALPGNRYIITLQTQARLFGGQESLQATGDRDGLTKLYARYWQEASQQNLALSHYFAQQTRVGGLFYWRHYRKNHPYQPEWLTQAGSVFVLVATGNSTSETIHKQLKDWQQLGLPPAEDRNADTWQTDPYRRENGFGEIRVNDRIHIDFANYEGGEWL